MNLLRLATVGVVTIGITACGNDDEPAGPPGPLAYVRYVHAMPDQGHVTVRLLDRVENMNVYNETFRYVGPYQGIAAGNRHFRVFRASADPATGDPTLVTTVVTDAPDLALTAGQYYTILHISGGGSGPRFVVLQDNPPTAAANQVAVRTIVAAPGGPNPSLDVYRTTTAASNATLPATAMFAGVQYGTVPGYASVAPDSLVLRLTPANSTTPVLAAVPAPAGAAASATDCPHLDPISGSRVGGTAMTAFIFPPSVTGTPAPQGGAFAAPGIFYAIDRRAPRPATC